MVNSTLSVCISAIVDQAESEDQELSGNLPEYCYDPDLDLYLSLPIAGLSQVRQSD